MAFSKSSRSIRLEQNADYRTCTLVAECQVEDEVYRESRLELNKWIGNDDGTFDTQGENFIGSAHALELNGSRLRGLLDDRIRHAAWAEIDLHEYVRNEGGVLKA